ncbi:hypothetical protein HZS_6257 [Henneguya salminicola]|nr:hypothetical protein HZS_6257 [Henneguya salminicola]
MQIKSEIKEDARNWCAKFIGGAWAHCNPEQFLITPIKGALTNYIYLCELNKTIPIEKHEHRRVILRLYGEISGSHEKFYEILIFNILSERKLGPKLLGAFKNGRIEQYIESRALSVAELREGSYLERIARKMAKFHLLEIPFDKRPKYITRFVEKYLPHIHRAFENNEDMTQRQKEIINTLASRNVIKEYEDLKVALEKMNSLTVYCHNDVQEGNLLVLPSNYSSPQLEQIMVIDFEYSYYGYRGYDIGNHFCEFIMQNVSDKPLGFDYDPGCYPTHQQQMAFAEAYLNCISEELKNSNDSSRNYFLTSPDSLIKEANHHSLMSHLFWGFWGVAQHYLSHIDFPFLVRIDSNI